MTTDIPLLLSELEYIRLGVDPAHRSILTQAIATIKDMERRLTNASWEASERRPRFDSYGGFDGYYP